MMSRLKVLAMVVLIAAIFTGCGSENSGPPKILVFSKTMGFRHGSIPAGQVAIQQLGAENGYEVELSENDSIFTDEQLSKYDAVVFLSTTGNVLNHYQEAAFERFIQAGGGFVGIHAATDTEYDWGWYGKLVGAYFLSHPHNQEATFKVEDKSFPATAHLAGDSWIRTDELYNFKKINPDINVILSIDESTYEGGANGDFHPMSWYHEYDGGRSFYTALGHTDESYKEPEFVEHLKQGIAYAMGDNNALDYSRATSTIPPAADRFSKVKLVQGGFTEPTEMTILPNHDVLVGQRRGEILHYKARTNEIVEVAKLDVYWKTLESPGVNAEEGLMGLQKDPNFENNNWVYVFYAPSGDIWINRLSRFKFIDGQFDLASEQVILDVASQREICCHTGGSIAFGPDNMLYLSTGDNSTPFNERGAKYVNNGYAPLNDLPGREQYDARRSSGNTNDLRGKILRIQVNEDGTYRIPDGNLFPVGTDKARPEIFTMGHRNPYRISVDPKKGWVYWGDVGPDARVDSLDTRGPRGYDEMNQAREAGNFGWPYFIGNNKAYYDYDYASGQSGEIFDPAAPVNRSRNNTGLTNLPPAQPAYVYYPYADTQEFPQVGAGGRNAMSGPVYYSDLYVGQPYALNEHYDEKVLIYEWMRGWMMAVSLFPDGTFNKMEPFATEIDLKNLSDMEMGPDGRIYLLEYGTAWFRKNDDSGLSYIDFNHGNRPPVVGDIEADRVSGKLPLKVNLSIEASDPDGDEMKYLWHLGNAVIETKEPSISYEYTKAGEFEVVVEVQDRGKAKSLSNELLIVSGNERPEVHVKVTAGNSSFFAKGVPVSYEVTVTDGDGEVSPEDIYVSVDYMESLDQAQLAAGHQQIAASQLGEAAIQTLDCVGCHKEAEVSIGPSYTEIAKRYKRMRGATAYITRKITGGGSGEWGEVTMPAHPNLTKAEVGQIVAYIQSLAEEGAVKKSLPLAGSLKPDPTEGDQVMIISASYTDKGKRGIAPLTGSGSYLFKSNSLPFSEDTERQNMQHVAFGGQDLLLLPDGDAWFAMEGVDMTQVKMVGLMVGWQEPPLASISFEIRNGSIDGPVIGSGTMNKPSGSAPGGMIPIVLNQKLDGVVDKLYFVHRPDGSSRGANPVALVNTLFQL